MVHGWCRRIKGWGLWVGLWGWDNRVVEHQGRHILCRGCPPFAHPAVARAMGPGTRQPVACNTPAHPLSAQSPRSRRLHYEQSCPAVSSTSADRSSRLLHFLPAPTDTRDPRPGLSPHRPASCSPQDTQHDVDPTTSHGPGHDPRHKEDSQAQGLWYAARRLRRAARPHPPTLLLGGPGLTAMAPHRLRRLGRLDRVHDQPRQQAQKDGEICEKRPPDIIEWSRRVQGGSLTPGPAPLGETPRADPPR